MAKQFFVKRPDGKKGPFTAAQIKKLLKSGKLTTKDEISQDGKKWHQIGAVLKNLRKRKSEVIEDYEVVDDVADVDDFLEDFDDDIEDYGDDEYGEFGPPVMAAPVWSGGSTSSKSKGRSAGNWSGASAGLSVFYYSYLLTAVVLIIFTSTVMTLMPAAVARFMVIMEFMDRSSMKGAFIIGDVFLVFVCLGFLGLMTNARGEVPWWGILSALYSIVLGIFMSPYFPDFARAVLEEQIPLIVTVVVVSYLISGLAQLIAWCMSLSVPSSSGLLKYIIIGLICLLIPTALSAYLQFGNVTSFALRLLITLAVMISAIGVFITFALYLRGIGRQFKKRSLIEAVDVYVVKTIIAISVIIGIFVWLFFLSREMQFTLLPIFSIGALYMGPYLVILLVDAIDQARDAVG